MNKEASIIYGFEVNSKDDKELLEYAREYRDEIIYSADIYSVGDGTYYIGNEIDSTDDDYGTDIGYLLNKEFAGEDIYSFCTGWYKDFFKAIKDKFGKTPSLYMIIK